MVKTNSLKAWFLAARPVTLTAAAVPVMLGVARHTRIPTPIFNGFQPCSAYSLPG